MVARNARGPCQLHSTTWLAASRAKQYLKIASQTTLRTDRFIMLKRKLGTQGLSVSELGLGCMGMSWAYGVPDDAESVATIERALELGVDFFDTAEVYGPHENE